MDAAFLMPAVKGLENNNQQEQFYLTDIVERAFKEGQNLSAFGTPDWQEILGVNNPSDLALALKTTHQRNRKRLLAGGVQLIDPDSTYIDDTVQVGAGTVIGPQSILKGETTIGQRVQIEGCCYINNATIDDDSYLKFGVRVEESKVGKECSIGPFAHLRPKSELESGVKIGNFVESKNASFDKGAKASHLSYIGDAKVGKDANIGAGTITCNYNGYKKSVTNIEDRAFYREQ